MLGKLIPCGGGPPVSLMKATLVVGRNPECDVSIPCKTVSGRHCELQFTDGSWWVRDLGSKNGISVNGVRCQKQIVAPNDIVAIGRNRFALAYQAAEKPRRTPAAKQDVEDAALAFLISDDEPVSTPIAPITARAPGPVAARAPAPGADKAPHPETSPAMGQLMPSGGGESIPLPLPELTVGRSPGCDIQLAFPAVSARHCKLSWKDGWWFVEDLKSSNGTWVDGVKCQKKCVPPEAVLAFGKHRFTIHYTASSDVPAPDEADIFSQGLLEKLGLSKKLIGPDEDASSRPAKTRDDPDGRKPYRLDLDGNES